jgi:hypothetical protein
MERGFQTRDAEMALPPGWATRGADEEMPMFQKTRRQFPVEGGIGLSAWLFPAIAPG